MSKVKEKPKKKTALELLRELLLTANKDVPLNVIESWDKKARKEVQTWAEFCPKDKKDDSEHVRAENKAIRYDTCPECLKDKFDKGIKRYKQSRELICKLTEQERLDAADQLARVMDSIDGAKKEKKSVVSGYAARINELESKATGLQIKVKDKVEVRKVDTEETWNYLEGIVVETRLDTKEVIKERRMTAEERQQNLFDDEPATNKQRATPPPAEPAEPDSELDPEEE